MFSQSDALSLEVDKIDTFSQSAALSMHSSRKVKVFRGVHRVWDRNRALGVRNKTVFMEFLGYIKHTTFGDFESKYGSDYLCDQLVSKQMVTMAKEQQFQKSSRGD